MCRIITLVLFVCLFAGLSGCKKTEELVGKQSGSTFTVGFECGYKPHGFIDPETKEYVGYDLDLAREVAKRRGWKLVLEPIDWTYKEQAINSGLVDCIWNGFKIEGREDQYTWSEPYMSSTLVVFVLRESGITQFPDLAGKILGAQDTTPAYDEFLKGRLSTYGNIFGKIVPISNFVLLIKELRENHVDAIATDIGAATRFLGDTNDVVALDSPRIETHDGIAFKLGNTVLRDQVQETFKEMVKDGTAASITQKWFDDDNVCILSPE